MSKAEEKSKKKQTTVRIENLKVVRIHQLNMEYKTLNKYINDLIRKDILRKGDEYTITKYFKEK